MSKLQNSFWNFATPKNSPLGLPKVKNDPEIKSKWNVRIERNKENENCSTTWVDPKIDLKPFPDPKNSQLGPKKYKWLAIKSKSKVRIEGTIENNSC